MLQNMLLTALTPLGIKNEANSWENRPFTTVWPDKLQQKTKDIKRTIKKKPRRARTAFSMEQIRTLEKTYSRYKYIDSERRCELAKSLNIGEKCIKVWFQNRRMKEKKESSESSCDSSSESFGNETPSVSASPLQTKPEQGTQYSNQYFHCNTDYSYQLPTYYNVHQNTYMQTPNVSSFYNDNNVYPTQYYPVEMNYYPCVEDSASTFHNHYGNEINPYWTPNHSSYYSPI